MLGTFTRCRVIVRRVVIVGRIVSRVRPLL